MESHKLRIIHHRQLGHTWTVVLGILYFIVACTETATELENKETDDDIVSQIVYPLHLSYRKWDYHIAQWLPEHPLYEMAELMVAGAETDHPEIWFFFTEAEPPKKQYHYVNTESLVDYLSGGAPVDDTDRFVRRVSMTLDITEAAGGDISFKLALDDENGTPITWTFNTEGPTTPEYAAGLIDQTGHDLEGGILIMYISESALSDETTVLQIGNDQFPIGEWVELSQPPYFTAYHGVCTRGLSHGYLAAATVEYETVSKPNAVETGAMWQMTYRIGAEAPSSPLEWIVDTVSNNAFVVKGGPYVLDGTLLNGGMETSQLRYETDDGYLAVRFSPPLPDLNRMNANVPASVRFAIDIDDHMDQIIGTATILREGKTTQLLLTPTSPSWSIANQMRIWVQFSKSGHKVEAETIQTD